MNRILTFFLLFAFTSCGDRVSYRSGDLPVPGNPPQGTTKFSWEDFAGKLFTAGSSSHFTDSCKFYFECDCCMDEILFSVDSTFTHIVYCLEEDAAFHGTYQFKADTLFLFYSGIKAVVTTNFDADSDSTLPPKLYSDTLLKPWSDIHFTYTCDGRSKFVSEDLKFIGIHTPTREEDSFVVRAKQRLTEMIDSLVINRKGFLISE